MPRATSVAAVRPAATTTFRSVSAAVTVDAPIAVIALGNALMGDDGFGPTTLALLEEHWRWPSSVALLASLGPVRRALSVDPIAVLRQD